MRYLTIFLSLFLLAAVFSSAAEPLPERGICSHRGWQSQYPENTVPAFKAAVEAGAQMIEMDVHYTKDHKMVILHDSTVDRTSNGTGALHTLTFDEVRALDFGNWKSPEFAGTQIPTFEEALAVIPRNIWINVHTGGSDKIAERLGQEIAETLIRENRTDQAFVACNHAFADAIKAKYPQIKICNMERQGGGDVYINDTIARKTEFIQLTDVPTPEQVKKLKDAGVKINYFGTNDPELMRTLFNLGVDFPLVDKLDIGLKLFSELENK